MDQTAKRQLKTEQYRVENHYTSMHYGVLSDRDVLESYSHALWVVDENTHRFLPPFARNAIEIPSGEEHKNRDSVEKILDAAVSLAFGRDDTIVGLGGGVICDMAGFAASVYMRGCNLVLVPSTLLAMNDASLGGKTGFDYLGYKNLVGSFYPAKDIYVFSDIVQTLSDRDYHSGLAEIIKHALLDGKDFLEFLVTHRKGVLNRDHTLLESIIPRSLKIKGVIVETDAREHGIRAHLNLGHTFGHALEKVSGFAVSHGEAVAWGIVRAMRCGVVLGITQKAYADAVENVIVDFGFNLSFPDYKPDNILAAMVMDKKKKDGKIRFVLQKDIGQTLLSEIPTDIIKKVLAG